MARPSRSRTGPCAGDGSRVADRPLSLDQPTLLEVDPETRPRRVGAAAQVEPWGNLHAVGRDYLRQPRRASLVDRVGRERVA